MSLPEVLLWIAIRGRALNGLRFRRQHRFGPYVLDFYCEEARLAVEIDGWCHNMGEQPLRDERRDAWLADQDVRTMRIPATEVLKDIESILDAILVESRRPPQSRLA